METHIYHKSLKVIYICIFFLLNFWTKQNFRHLYFIYTIGNTFKIGSYKIVYVLFPFKVYTEEQPTLYTYIISCH